MIGTTLHHYRIIRPLGRGGMGEVYAAEDTRLNRAVALKVLSQITAADPERLSRFQREAKAIAAINHPNIVTIYSVEEADGRPVPDDGARRGEAARHTDPARRHEAGCASGARGCRWPMPSALRTSAASSTEISSRPTSWSAPTVG